MINTMLLDFGGVIAEEGFRLGISHIAEKLQQNPDELYDLALATVYSSGYVSGKTDEHGFWQQFRQQVETEFTMKDSELTEEILSRFVVRPEMIELVRELKAHSYFVGILSDQSDWLDILDSRYGFKNEFDIVLNSYYLGRTKRDHRLFSDVLQQLDKRGSEVLFVDDNEGHVERAKNTGMYGHHFKSPEIFRRFLVSHNLL